MTRERSGSTFSLAFLDIMFCGFGAVVLLVMIVNGKTLQKRDEVQGDLRAELERVAALEEFARSDHDALQNEVNSLERQARDLSAQAAEIQASIADQENENQGAAQSALERQRKIDELERRQVALGKDRSKLEEEAKGSSAKHLVGFDGEGQRQYLTGLKLGGKHTLILIDVSASMLDETIVNIVRRKLMSEAERRSAPKWKRVMRSLHWLIANLQPGKFFQVYSFNTMASAVVPGTDGQWMDSGDSSKLEAAIENSRLLAPQGGTNLEKAFMAIDQFRPRPDSVLLLTDGLPTQGGGNRARDSVSAEKRFKLFHQAALRVPAGVPINTLLFPLEGDPAAAAAFWKLAIVTAGSAITPSRDWP